jgi:predicted molibdopterin-dependent oxidoreductase YjgC
VEDGMVIRTQTAQVETVRAETLQLLLSEHPASCLICDEKEECKQFSGTIRKAGVTTGCRYCPNDGQCELAELVERLGTQEIHYPALYRNLPIEKEDPFYDRDYNLCILCGRCVRMCQELRAAGTLAFKQRGPRTVVGPAFARTHLEAGCEFCGACVSVCPTGALSEKTRKWDGKPERTERTTCAFCGVGCQVQLLVKGGAVIGSLPAEGAAPNFGQLCVKGRFCVTELVNDHRRLRGPRIKVGQTQVETSWDEAIAVAAEKLSATPPERFRMILSPNCTNEDLYVAQKFARVAMRSSQFDVSARAFYGPAFDSYLRLFRMSAPLAELRRASVILSIGLDSRFGRSVVGVELRRAIARGAKVITLHSRDHNLGFVASKWLQPARGQEVGLLRSLVSLTQKWEAPPSRPRGKTKSQDPDEELKSVAALLAEASSPVILVGSEFLHGKDGLEILDSIERLAHRIAADILPLPVHNNLVGSVLMGAYPELLPGGYSSADPVRVADLERVWRTSIPPPGAPGGGIDALYLVGEVLATCRPAADFVIAQNTFGPEPAYDPDLTLPAAAFSEADGTAVNGERRIRRLRKAVEPPGLALPDWKILCRIAQKMGVPGFAFASARDVHEEISTLVEGFGSFDAPSPEPIPFRCEASFAPAATEPEAVGPPDADLRFALRTSPTEHVYRGFPIATWVEGARVLFADGFLQMNPEDAREIGISPGNPVLVSGAHLERIWPARIVSTQPPGTLDVILPPGEFLGPNPIPVRIARWQS